MTNYIILDRKDGKGFVIIPNCRESIKVINYLIKSREFTIRDDNDSAICFSAKSGQRVDFDEIMVED
jgi:hypothetical protein